MGCELVYDGDGFWLLWVVETLELEIGIREEDVHFCILRSNACFSLYLVQMAFLPSSHSHCHYLPT